LAQNNAQGREPNGGTNEIQMGPSGPVRAGQTNSSPAPPANVAINKDRNSLKTILKTRTDSLLPVSNKAALIHPIKANSPANLNNQVKPSEQAQQSGKGRQPGQQSGQSGANGENQNGGDRQLAQNDRNGSRRGGVANRGVAPYPSAAAKAAISAAVSIAIGTASSTNKARPSPVPLRRRFRSVVRSFARR